MPFELDEALIDAIIFSMEDQGTAYFVDSEEGIVLSEEEILENEDEVDEDRYIPIPYWDSNEGFRLMERFVVALKNPLAKVELTRALDRGKGVFRAFKDTLSRYPVIEKRWFRYKEQAMRRTVLEWYNGLREDWGLERIGTEPEETEDLLGEDITIRPSREEDTPSIQQIHEQCLMDLQRVLTEKPRRPQKAGLYLVEGRSQHREGNQKLEEIASLFFTFQGFKTGDIHLVAETTSKEIVGYILVHRSPYGFHVTAIEVLPEYRGLGIGEQLLEQALARIPPETTQAITIDIPAYFEGFSRVIARHGFTPLTIRYIRHENSLTSSEDLI
ncbi:UPF0158 family protein [Treponema sp. J25]|uniref:UPF0158 family protein n=1 Tax=Treponema sp. J25 TaxID=2094121 RepID=UPI00104DA9B0|nr:UPF0158 family protein [Treponema sp. J25]TCW61503.1 GNAT family N-acetyltransferase [Treponema sp. J25]